jgi:AcrR family transcriptional regulator
MKATKGDWATAMLELLADGRDPGTLMVKELCQRLGVTRGAFYNRFEDMAELQEAALTAWLDGKLASLPGNTVGAVRDPLERLRLLHAAVRDSAPQEIAMRRWAVTDPGAAQAVAQADEQVHVYLTQSLTDLGFGPRESLAMASLLAAALSAAGPAAAGPRTRRRRQGKLPPLADPATWESVLTVIGRAAAAADGRGTPPGPDDVQVTAGDEPDEVILSIRSLSPADRRQLLDLARHLGSQQDDPAAAGEAAGA